MEIESLISKMESEDHASDREGLRTAFASCISKPQGFVFFSNKNSDYYMLMHIVNDIPNLTSSIQVTGNNMTFILRYESYVIDIDSYSSFMKFPHKICCFTDFLNLMAFLNAKKEGTSSTDSFSILKAVIKNFIVIVDQHLSGLDGPVSKSLFFVRATSAGCYWR